MKKTLFIDFNYDLPGTIFESDRFMTSGWLSSQSTYVSITQPLAWLEVYED